MVDRKQTGAVTGQWLGQDPALRIHSSYHFLQAGLTIHRSMISQQSIQNLNSLMD